MDDSLEIVTGKVNALWHKMEDYRATIGRLMVQAKALVDAGDDFAEGLSWKNYASLHFLTKDGKARAPRTIRELLQIGNSPDPEAKAAEIRSTNQSRMVASRDAAKVNVERTDSEKPARVSDDVFATAEAIAEKYGPRLRHGPREHQWWHVPGLLDDIPSNLSEVKKQYYALGWIKGELQEPWLAVDKQAGEKLEEAQRFFPTKKAWNDWLKTEIKTCEMSTREANGALAVAAKAQPADDYIYSLKHDQRVDVLLGIIKRRLTPEAKSELHARLEEMILAEPTEAAPPVCNTPNGVCYTNALLDGKRSCAARGKCQWQPPATT